MMIRLNQFVAEKRTSHQIAGVLLDQGNID